MCFRLELILMSISHQNVSNVTGLVERTACLALSVLATFAEIPLQICLRPAGVEFYYSIRDNVHRVKSQDRIGSRPLLMSHNRLGRRPVLSAATN